MFDWFEIGALTYDDPFMYQIGCTFHVPNWVFIVHVSPPASEFLILDMLKDFGNFEIHSRGKKFVFAKTS